MSRIRDINGHHNKTVLEFRRKAHRTDALCKQGKSSPHDSKQAQTRTIVCNAVRQLDYKCILPRNVDRWLCNVAHQRISVRITRGPHQRQIFGWDDSSRSTVVRSCDQKDTRINSTTIWVPFRGRGFFLNHDRGKCPTNHLKRIRELWA